MAYTTVQEFAANTSAKLARVKPGAYYSITEEGREVLVISRWEQQIDSRKQTIRIGLARLAKRAGFLLHFARDTGVTLVVADRGTPKYIIEPGDELREALMTKLGCEDVDFAAAIRRSDVFAVATIKLRRARKKLRELGKAQKTEIEHLVYEIEQRDEDVSREKTYTQILEAELAALRDKYRDYEV